MDMSVNGPQKMGNLIIEEVWYEGTDAVKQGEALCYNTDYGTAADFDGRRCNRVERPSTSNNMAFAGVAERDYSAKNAGQRIRIAVPGSKGVPIALGVNSVIGTGLLTFSVGTGGLGRFVKAGLPGRGSAIPRQTNASAVIESSMTGAWSLSAAGTTLTMASTTGLAVGDTVVLIGGEDDGTGVVVPGKYTIVTVPAGGTTVTIATAVDTTAAGALLCTGYAYTGNPTCQADLLTGEESGGVEFVSTPEAGGAAVMTFMVGGTTYICGGVTVASAVANGALAEGVYPGARKCFSGLGALASYGVTVTPAATGYEIDGTALTTITIDAANEIWLGEWAGSWATVSLKGATTA
jgi:hypothetical protein